MESKTFVFYIPKIASHSRPFKALLKPYVVTGSPTTTLPIDTAFPARQLTYVDSLSEFDLLAANFISYLAENLLLAFDAVLY